MGKVEVEARMAAPPGVVWSLLSDPTRMGEWSPECVAGRWLDGATAAVPGARFRGANRLGRRRWSTVCTLTEVVPERDIAWKVASVGLPVALWSYRIRPDGDGSVVTETFADRRGGLVRLLGTLVRGVKDAESHNLVMMHRTLEAVRVAAETAGPIP